MVAVPFRAETRVTLALGAHVERLFLSQLALAFAGLLLLVVRGLLRSRDRRKHGRAGDTGDGATYEAPRVVEPGAEPSRALPRHPGGRTARREAAGREATPPPAPTRPARAPSAEATRPQERTLPKAVTLPVLGVLLLALALSGCAAPRQAPARTTDDPPTRPGMTAAEAREVVDDPRAVLTPEFARYPVWASVVLAEPRRVQLRVRDAFDAPYRTIATVKVVDRVPHAIDAPRKPSGKVRKRADRAATAVSTWWATGSAEGVRLTPGTRKARERMMASGVTPGAVWVIGGGHGDQYLVEVDGGHLLTVRHQVFTPRARRLTTVVLLPQGKKKAQVLGSKLVDVD